MISKSCQTSASLINKYTSYLKRSKLTKIHKIGHKVEIKNRRDKNIEVN